MPEPANAPDLSIEREWQRSGILRVAGIDEVGRGALAGPVMAAAVILPNRASTLEQLSGVRDSKRLTAAERERMAWRIREASRAWAVGMSSAAEIDRIGILRATALAMRRAIQGLDLAPEAILVDGLPIDLGNLPQRALVKGDDRSLSIAAASILAKIRRDAYMLSLARQPELRSYALDSNKGYGSAAHRAAIKALGPSPHHRLSWLESMRAREREARSQLELPLNGSDLAAANADVSGDIDVLPRLGWERYVPARRDQGLTGKPEFPAARIP